MADMIRHDEAQAALLQQRLDEEDRKAQAQAQAQARLQAEKQAADRKSKEKAQQQEKESSESEEETICNECEKAIKEASDGFQISGKPYHKACFVCKHCEKQYDASFTIKDGKPICVECFTIHYAKLCAGCGKAIRGHMVTALAKPWHKECFICSACGGSLAAGFADDDGKPICGDCLEE